MGGLRQTIKAKLASVFNSTVVERSTYLTFVDGLRGIAVLMVVLVHTSQHVGAGSFKTGMGSYFVLAGSRGVQLFFILSAFTLFNTSMRHFKKDKKPYSNFYIRRALRILPFWVIINVFWASYSGVSLWLALASTSFIFGFLRFDDRYDVVPGGWSLFVEETFYLFLPLIFSKIKDIYRALGLVVGLYLLSDIWMTRAAIHPHINQNNFVPLAPLAQWFCFGLGILAFYIYSHPRIQAKIFQNPSANLLLDSLAGLGVWYVGRQDFRNVAIGLLLIFLAAIPASTLTGKIARGRLLRRFGKYAYSMYLLQFVVLTQGEGMIAKYLQFIHLQNRSLEIRVIAVYPLVALVLLILSAISFNLIEKFFIDLGKRIIQRREARATTLTLQSAAH